jgi:N-acetylmuramoyl-L-alanine amidase
MILRLNSRGERVVELQKLLNITPADGVFGQKTRNAVIEFQKQNRLTADGVIGPKTWGAILKNAHANKVKPIFQHSVNEDFGDPEEVMLVENIKESQPTCPNIVELITLINNAILTRTIRRVVFHCTATQLNATVEAILRYWKNVLGWKNPGYHIIVTGDGSWTLLQDFNKITNGVQGMNSDSLHISYIGGIDRNGKALDTRTEKQTEILETIYLTLKSKFPSLTFHGHNEFSNKSCPSFNVKNWLSEVNKKLN